MSTSRFVFIATVVLFFLPSQIFAHPVINEVYPVGSDDWVEIHNPPSEPAVDLSQYVLRDSSKTNKVTLTGNLAPGGFAVFAFGNKLNNGGDTVKLVQNSDNSVVSEQSYGKGTECVLSENQSVGRNTQGTVVIFSSPTKGQQNNDGSLCVKAKTTPAPIETKPEPTVRAVIEEIPQTIYEEPFVKAASTEEETPTIDSPSNMPSTTAFISATKAPIESKPTGVVGNAVIGLGVVCILVSIVGFLRILKKRYNEKHAQEGR